MAGLVMLHAILTVTQFSIIARMVGIWVHKKNTPVGLQLVTLDLLITELPQQCAALVPIPMETITMETTTG